MMSAVMWGFDVGSNSAPGSGVRVAIVCRRLDYRLSRHSQLTGNFWDLFAREAIEEIGDNPVFQCA